MALALVILLPALLVGWLTGGRIGRLGDVRLRHGFLVLPIVGLQYGAEWLAPHAGPVLRWTVVVATVALLSWWFAANVGAQRGVLRAAVVLAGLGWCANAVVMVANGGMPVSRWAVAKAHGHVDRIGHGHLDKHIAAASHTSLRFLGDVIGIRPLRGVFSVGDFALAAGIAVFVVAAMHLVEHAGQATAHDEAVATQ